MANPRKVAPAPEVPASGAPNDDQFDMGGRPSLNARDRFAMHAPAMPAWWTNDYMARAGRNVIDAEAMAIWAYEYADAMVAERSK